MLPPDDGPTIPSKKRFPDHITFGTEFELFIPNPNNYWNKLTIAQYYVSKGIRAQDASYHGDNYTIWQIKSDSSIHPGSASLEKNAFPFELVGPILKGDAGLKTLKNVLEVTKGLGVRVNKSCGFHVHIGESAWHGNVNNLKAIVKNYIKHELAFNCMIPPSRIDNEYCQSNNNSSILRSCNPGRKFEKIMECSSVSDIRSVIQDDRYYKFNLPENKTTIEFRQHSATYEWEKACRWVKILAIFADQSVQHPPTLNFNSDKGADYQFNALFDTVIKDETLKAWAVKRKAKFGNQ